MIDRGYWEVRDQDECIDEIEILNELVNKLDEYIQFLDIANRDAIGMAYAHGWRCLQEDIDKGIKLRKEIEMIRGK